MLETLRKNLRKNRRRWIKPANATIGQNWKKILKGWLRPLRSKTNRSRDA